MIQEILAASTKKRHMISHMISLPRTLVLPANAAFYGDVMVGAVCCRIEVPDPASPVQRLYIMTLGVLAPYRRHGIGTCDMSLAEWASHGLQDARTTQPLKALDVVSLMYLAGYSNGAHF